MIKALIFDCYGTIISTGNTSVNGTKKILDNLKIDIDPILFYKDWKKIHRENIFNLKYLFNGIYTSEKIKAYKPSKIFFEKILKKIKFNKDEILFIGDSLEDDIIGANNVGLKTVLIDRKNNYQYIKNEANYLIKDMYELINIIK